MLKIGVLIPFRADGIPSRLEKLETCMKTLEDATECPDAVEVVLCVDKDDPSYSSAISIVSGADLYTHAIICQEKETPVYKWNRCAEATTADLFLCCGHDIEFRTYGWDTMHREAIEKFPNKIGMVYSFDGHWKKGEKAGNHCVHRNWVEAIGHWQLPDLQLYYSDDYFTVLGKEVGMTFMKDCLISHNHPCRKDIQVPTDEIYEKSNAFYEDDKPAYDHWLKYYKDDYVRILKEAQNA